MKSYLGVHESCFLLLASPTHTWVGFKQGRRLDLPFGKNIYTKNGNLSERGAGREAWEDPGGKSHRDG